MKRIFLMLVFALVAFVSYAQYSVSLNGQNFIKEHEGCELTPYVYKSHRYIGYGHQIRQGEHYTKITKQQADKIFAEDLKKLNASVNELLAPINHRFSQGFVDGFASMVYRYGKYGVQKTTFYKRLLACRSHNGKLNSKDLNYTIAAVKSSKYKRRTDGEYKLMIG